MSNLDGDRLRSGDEEHHHGILATAGSTVAPLLETGVSATARSHKNLLAGAMMILIGLFALTRGTSYHVGTLTNMGAGFFPAALGGLLILVGFVIAVTGGLFGRRGIARARAMPQLRGWFCISLGIISFVVVGKYGGLLPATFAVVFISALGDRSNSVRDALLLALALMVVSFIVFSWALQLQLPLFQWAGQ